VAPEAVAVISVHVSPLSQLGRGENGGMNLAIRRLCEGLADRGVPTDVFTRRDDSRSPDEELIAPMSRLVRLRAGPARPMPKAEVRGICDEFADAVLAHAHSESRSYRVVHGHYWLGGLVARRLREHWATPWVQSFHTLARTKARAGLPLDLRRSLTEAVLVGGADRLVAASASEAKDLIRLYRAPRAKICVAQPGVAALRQVDAGPDAEWHPDGAGDPHDVQRARDRVPDPSSRLSDGGGDGSEEAPA